MKILIDGYNLIFECGLHGRRINAESLARARELMLIRIRDAFSPSEQAQIVVVFDAKKLPLSNQQEQECSGAVKVLYSIEFEDADEMIESLIAGHSAPKQLLIVSSDHRLQRAAQKRRAQFIDTGDWFDQITHRSQGPANCEAEQADSKTEAGLLSDSELEQFKKDVDDQISGFQRRDKKRDW